MQLFKKNSANNATDLISKKISRDKVLKYGSFASTFVLFAIFLAMISFIFARSIQAFSEYGIENILFTTNFDFSGDQVSFWLPFSMTLLTTFTAVAIAAPLGVKTAMFIHFRIGKKYQQYIRLFVETLAGIPSVVFGVFASHALGELIRDAFGLNTVFTAVNASIMLAFMILPTIIAVSFNSLKAVNFNLLTNPIAVGSSKTRAMYKVYKRAARSGIVVGVILAVGRAIGEAMALSMILQSQNYTILNNGIFNVLENDLRTVSSLISFNMFADNTSEVQKSLLFAFGFLLFIFVGLINVLILYVSREKTKSKSKTKAGETLSKVSNFLYLPFTYMQTGIDWMLFKFEKIFFFNRQNIDVSNTSNMIQAAKVRAEKYQLKDVYSGYKIFWEIFAAMICFSFLVWIVLNIFINGASAVTGTYQSIFSYSRNSTGQAFFNTVLIIIVAIGISLPLSLIIAVYLNEFAKSKGFKKVTNFFLDALGSTPSILFGLFGLILFIQTLGISANGVRGNSLIAGALTISIVILPSFIRSINLALISVPVEARQNAYALGSNKFEVVKSVVLPWAFTGIVTSVILAISRIFAESAPLYLTAGLTSSSFSTLDRPGQTLTTRIFAQLTNTNSAQAFDIMYESAFLLLLLVLFLVTVAYVVIPNWRQIKRKSLYYMMIAKDYATGLLKKNNDLQEVEKNLNEEIN